ncbi:DNA polymerase delta subunit 3 [Brienomyrus brachyistius]|uniref:DNA polymerase delta subunit 3 n=1 Tax=Brienomyrus brachyistius TaxID=42636 RepID=UPI0020B3BD5B|nr:DNA polymerase delta subunit 3 [Brienomyrus brachyistius]
MDDLYLENIDEFVNDHNKIVTYKWLSLTLGVHVNQAKQMLFHYLDQKRKESSGSQLHATYLVSGKVVTNGGSSHKVAVVREDQLEDVKSKMDVTVSIHVYSIQKAVLKDSGPLYSTDYDAVKENLKNCCKYSAIRCTGAAPLPSDVPRQSQEIEPVAPLEIEAKKSVVNGGTAAANKKAAKPQKGIMGMFNKSTSKTPESSKEVKMEENEDTATETTKSKPSLKAHNFFGKQTTSKAGTSGEKSRKTIKEEAVGSQTSHLAVEEPSKSPLTTEIKEEEAKSSNAAGKQHNEGKSNKMKRLEQCDSDDEKFESRKKKRRRIKKPQLSSSDDEVIADSPAAPEAEVPTPSPESKVKEEPVSQAKVNSEGKRRKRRRVIKSRTFVDEDGCMVTEKGFESESYSESDDDFRVSKQHLKEPGAPRPTFKKNEEENRSQKRVTAAAGKAAKQASIMGFFVKK